MQIDLGSIGQGLVNIGVWAIAIILLGTVTAIIAYLVMSYKRFNHIVYILQKTGFGTPVIKSDLAGIFVDNKTKNKRFFLKSNMVGLNPDRVPFITNLKGQKVVFLKQLGLKNYQYISFENFFKELNTIEVGEEDVNWAINDFARSKVLGNQSMFQKLLPYIGLIVMGVFIIGMIVVVLGKVEIIKDAAVALKEAAAALAQAKSGTTIIS